MALNQIIILLDDTDPDSFNVAFPFLSTWPEDKWVAWDKGASIISTPVCYASRITQTFGARADRCGGAIPDVLDWGPPTEDLDKSIFKALDNAGYDVGFVGKWVNKYPWGETAAVPPGMSWVRLEHDSANDYYSWTDIDESLSTTSHGTAEADYRTTVEQDYVIDFLEQATEPFVLFWSPLAAHLPGVVAPEFASAAVIDSRTGLGYDDEASDPAAWDTLPSDPAGYMSAISAMDGTTKAAMRTQRLNMARQLLSVDKGIEDIFTWLDENNHLNDTIVIIYSDNGGANGVHRLSEQLKRHPYQHSADAQFRVRHPSCTHTGMRSENRLVSSVDVPATVLDIAGATALYPLDGVSIEPIVLNQVGTIWRTGLEAAGFNEPVADLLDQEAPSWWSFRTKRWKYVYFPDDGSGSEHEELYDLRDDPSELTSVATANPDITAWLRNRLRYARAIPDGARGS